VAINPAVNYLLIRHPVHGTLIIVEALAKSVVEGSLHLALSDAKCSPISGQDLLDCTYTNPLIPNCPEYPILPANYVTSESGTGLVHSAPGHGVDDYNLLAKYNVSPFSPVDHEGKYTEGVEPKSLQGLAVLNEGNEAVIKLLEESGALLHQHDYKHKYPYDWRSKEPVIVRATEQWFANVDNIKGIAIDAIQGTRMIPETSVPRLISFVQGRNEWCISRQRAWGVPIPALYNVDTAEPLLTFESVEYIISVIREVGTDEWFNPDSAVEWVAPQYRGTKYRRGTETMDVWFDSGTSWSMIPGKRKQADIYLEGTDQHRGWFQSSLLTSVATQGIAPFKTLITHGFVLDKEREKMSKSLGNIIAPREIVQGKRGGNMKGGVDGMRLWAASSEYTMDVAVNEIVLGHMLGGLQKIRATLRYLIGNLHDAVELDVKYSDLSKVFFHEQV
jgi:isoleucyl-tRNA synthetase